MTTHSIKARLDYSLETLWRKPSSSPTTRLNSYNNQLNLVAILFRGQYNHILITLFE